MVAIGQSEEVQALVRSLGIDPANCRGLDIRIRCDEAILVQVHVYGLVDSVKRLGDVIIHALAADPSDDLEDDIPFALPAGAD